MIDSDKMPGSESGFKAKPPSPTLHGSPNPLRCLNPYLLMPHRLPFLWGGILFSVLTLWTPMLNAALTPANVLLIYNDPGNTGSTDGALIKDHYLAAYPGVHTFNLNDANLSPGRVTYAVYENQIRNPIRAHLNAENLSESVRVFLLTKGIPHQIEDINEGPIGTSAGTTQEIFLDDNATLASVDSELCLLWHDLASGENNTGMDSLADNFVTNPYFDARTPLPASILIDNPLLISFSEVDVVDEDDEETVLFRYWEIDDTPLLDEAGLIYLTSRLDGNQVSDAMALVDRAAGMLLDQKHFAIVLDETQSGGFDEEDYADTAAALAPQWDQILHDTSGDFFVGDLASRVSAYPSCHLLPIRSPIALLASYGANHPGGNHTEWVWTFEGQVPYGAILNTYESFNGIEFGNQTGGSAEHGQVADWIAIGGTFGLGHVWEPFALAVGRNEVLTENFYQNDLTWVEAAWSSIQIISWQNIVLGDPLAKAIFTSPAPTVTLSTAPDTQQLVLEGDTAVYQVTLQIDTAPTSNLTVPLRFAGATLSEDFTTSLGSATSATIPANTNAITFTVSILDDVIDEGLEILDIAVMESVTDTNGDGIGEDYHFGRSVQIPIADNPIDWWLFDHFRRHPVQVASGDCDGDGFNHLVEYFVDSDPSNRNAPSSDNVLDLLEGAMRNASVSLTLPPISREDVRLLLETSPTLAPPVWSIAAQKQGSAPWLSPVGTTTDSGEGPHEVIVTPPAADRAFFQFRLEQVVTP